MRLRIMSVNEPAAYLPQRERLAVRAQQPLLDAALIQFVDKAEDLILTSAHFASEVEMGDAKHGGSRTA
jgi:hypothetical protein